MKSFNKKMDQRWYSDSGWYVRFGFLWPNPKAGDNYGCLGPRTYNQLSQQAVWIIDYVHSGFFTISKSTTSHKGQDI